MGPVGNALHALLSGGDELRADFKAPTLAEESGHRIPNEYLPRKSLDDEVLGVAQELGATFLVHQNRAICSIRGVTADGDSYCQAALNTILALLKPGNRGGATF